MSNPEFSHPVDARNAHGQRFALQANVQERAALAERFGLVQIDLLEADVSLTRQGKAIEASGRFKARIVQSCAVSGEDLPVAIDEDITLRFVPAAEDRMPDEEVEIDAEDLDEIEYQGTSFDLGEAVAQSLALAIDPFAVGPEAEAARRKAGLLDESEAGPFAVLKGLKTKE